MIVFNMYLPVTGAFFGTVVLNDDATLFDVERVCLNMGVVAEIRDYRPEPSLPPNVIDLSARRRDVRARVN